jgi:hypothetical protein
LNLISRIMNSSSLDDQRKTPVQITVVQRWLIVLACTGVAIIGCFLIQHDGN